MSKHDELKQANEDLAYWEGIFKPLGCRVYGWTYRNTCQIVTPNGNVISIDQKILELVNCARKAEPICQGKIEAKYNNGIDETKDQSAFTIARKFNAELIGSGCRLHEPFERDLEWVVPDENARAMASELRKVGFKVTVC